jgi:hypothetical protein
MKQCISLNQIKETSVNFLNKLIVELHISKYYRGAIDRTIIYEEEVLKDIASNCTIGKMIEVLCDSDFCFPSIGLTESKKIHEYIVVGVYCLSGSKQYRGKCFEGDNLCDALWDAVKSVLSED